MKLRFGLKGGVAKWLLIGVGLELWMVQASRGAAVGQLPMEAGWVLLKALDAPFCSFWLPCPASSAGYSSTVSTANQTRWQSELSQPWR